MKLAVKIFISTGLLCGASWHFLVPEYQKDKLVGALNSEEDDRKCFTAYKRDFKNPSTAYFVKSYISTKEQELEYNEDNVNPVFDDYDSVLNVISHDRDGMGVYRMVLLECPLVNGKFNKEATQIWSMKRKREK